MSDTSIEIFCQTCGYNLRGLSGDRCPECGVWFDPNQARGADIPWLKRPVIGTWNAYWQTVAAVMFHPMKVATDLWNAPRAHPSEATKFRLILIVQAVITVILVSTALCWGKVSSGTPGQLKILVAIETVFLIAPGMFLLIATDLTHEDSWQRSMQYYACAPLALLPACGAIVLLIAKTNGPFVLAVWLSLVLMLGWWWLNQILFTLVAKRSVLACVLHAIVMPIGWVFIALGALLCGSAVAGVVVALMS